MRIKIVRVIIIVLFIFLSAELVYVQIIRGDFYFHLSKNNRIRVVPLEGQRGKVLDRNGTILADNILSYDVAVIPQDIENEDELFGFVSETLKLDKDVVAKNYQRRRFTPFAPVVIGENLTREEAIIIEENRYRFPSLFVQESYERFYPFDYSTAHILGYVGRINRALMEKYKEYGYSSETIVGYSGIEEYYDQYLKGVQGGKQIEVNSRGQQVRLLGLKQSVRGEDITLTIDAGLQQAMSYLLQGKLGAMVVMDMDNGEVLGLASSPSFDPNHKTSPGAFSPYLNRAVQGKFPPGSVFKIPVAMGAMDSNKVSLNTTFFCPGYLMLGETRFGCTHVHEMQDLVDAIAHSCNVYFYHVGQLLGPDIMNHYATLFGLGNKTGIDLPYEEPGFIPSRLKRLLQGKRRWYGGDTLNFAIGQGDVQTTPIQLVKMMAIIGHNGIEVQPHLIKSVSGHDVAGFPGKQIRLNKEHLSIIQRAMRQTVESPSGTAHELALPDIEVSGKTGTAQSSHGKENHAWFVGYAKTAKRTIAFCVFLEHGGSSQNACILSKELLIKMREMEMI
jgi:penicillin-binding protein 2